MSELLIENDELEMGTPALDTSNLPDQPGGGGFRIIPGPLKEFGKGYLTGWANVFASGGRGLEATGRTINRPFVRYPRAEHPYLNRADELPPWVEINSLGIPYAPAGVLGPEPVSLEGITIPTIQDLDIGGVRVDGMDVADEERKREFFTPDPKLKQARELNAYLTQAEEMNDPAAYALTKVGQGVARLGETALDSFPSWQRHPKLMGRDWKELLADPETQWIYLGRVFGESLPQVAAALGVTVGVSAATANPYLGVAAGTGFSYTLATGESFQAYKDLGASDEEAAETACLVGLVSAAVETVPLGRFMLKTPGFKQIFTSRLQQHLGQKLIQDLAFRNMYKEAFKQGLTEGGTEAIQQVIQNYGKSFFNDNQDLFEGVDEAAFIGFLLGNTYSHAGQLASRAFVVSNDRLALKDRAAAEAAADLERLKTWNKMGGPRLVGTSKTRIAKRLEIELSKQMEPEKARLAAEVGAWEMEQRARRWAAHKGRHPEEWWDRFLPQSPLPDEGKVVIRDGDMLELAAKTSIPTDTGEHAAEKAPDGQVAENLSDVDSGIVEERALSGVESQPEQPTQPSADPDSATENLSGKTTLPMDETVAHNPGLEETDYQTHYVIQESTPEEFVAARAYIPAKYRPFLTWHTSEALSEHKVYLVEGQQAGYALDPNGDLQNVFNASGVKGLGDELLSDAIARGATTLDCIDDRLRELYEDAGFEVVEVLGWDDTKAPVNWDYKTWGRPSIYLMRYMEGLSREKTDVRRRIQAARRAEGRDSGGPGRDKFSGEGNRE